MGGLLEPPMYLALTAFNVCLAALSLPLAMPFVFLGLPEFFIQFGVFRIEILPDHFTEPMITRAPVWYETKVWKRIHIVMITFQLPEDFVSQPGLYVRM